MGDPTAVAPIYLLRDGRWYGGLEDRPVSFDRVSKTYMPSSGGLLGNILQELPVGVEEGLENLIARHGSGRRGP